MSRGNRKISKLLAVLALCLPLGEVHGEEEILVQRWSPSSGGFSTGVGQSFFLPGKTSITAIEISIGPEAELVQANIWETERVNRRLRRKILEGFPRTRGVVNNHEIAGESRRWVHIELAQEYRNLGTEAVELVLDFTLTTDGEDTVTKFSHTTQDLYTDGEAVRWLDWMNEYQTLPPRDLTFRIIGEGFPVEPAGWFGKELLIVPGDEGCYAIYFKDYLVTSTDLESWWYPVPRPRSPHIIEPAKSPISRRNYYYRSQ